MIYDIHTHVGLDLGFYLSQWWPYASTAQDLLEHMDRGKVDRAVCFPFALPSAFDVTAFVKDGLLLLKPGCTPFEFENELLLNEVKLIDTQRRLRVLAMFDPEREVANQVKRLRTQVDRLTGLKVQGTIIQGRIGALLNQGRALMELAAEHDLPVLIHTSMAPDDIWSQASVCLDVAQAFPTVRFNLAHSLRYSLSNLKRAAQLDNVWIDCSAHLAHCTLAAQNSVAIAARDDRVDADYTRPVEVLQAVAAILRPDQYLWGTDNPYQSWCANGTRLVFRYQEEVDVFNALPAALKKSMGETSALQWLGKREKVHP